MLTMQTTNNPESALPVHKSFWEVYIRKDVLPALGTFVPS